MAALKHTTPPAPLRSAMAPLLLATLSSSLSVCVPAAAGTLLAAPNPIPGTPLQVAQGPSPLVRPSQSFPGQNSGAQPSFPSVPVEPSPTTISPDSTGGLLPVPNGALFWPVTPALPLPSGSSASTTDPQTDQQTDQQSEEERKKKEAEQQQSQTTPVTP